MLFNFARGRLLGRKAGSPRRKKSILIFGIAVNLLLLGYYKYANFFVMNEKVIPAAVQAVANYNPPP
jgi:alginate O-acetyltransferase complex protein AlgI